MIVENRCEICKNSENNFFYDVEERLLGLGDCFSYMECSKCGLLQLIDMPEDFGKYYPSDYYSFAPFHRKKRTTWQKVGLFIGSELRNRYYRNKWKILTQIVFLLFPNRTAPIEPCENLMDKRILDIGCGNAYLLHKMLLDGFNYLYGVDPFVDDSFEYVSDNHTGKISVLKGELFDIGETFDIIMLNHSLEHMKDQEKVMMHVNKLLSETGECIIRIPTVSSPVWSKYREFWYHLDAPRHLFLHSIKSFTILFQKCGLKIMKFVNEPSEGYIRSEFYKKGLNIEQQNKYLKTIFGRLLLVKHSIYSYFLTKRSKSDSIRIHLTKER